MDVSFALSLKKQMEMSLGKDKKIVLSSQKFHILWENI